MRSPNDNGARPTMKMLDPLSNPQTNFPTETDVVETQTVHQTTTASRLASLDPALVPVAGELVHPLLVALDDSAIRTPPVLSPNDGGKTITVLTSAAAKMKSANSENQNHREFLQSAALEIESLLEKRRLLRR